MYTVSLQNTSAYDQATGGGKALTLGKLLLAGLPVPQGFVVLTSAYERFVTVNRLHAEIEQLVQSVSPDQPATAEAAASRIATLFEQTMLPVDIEAAVLDAYQRLAALTVAVRSSATAEDLPSASFAGLYETILGLSSAAEMCSALKRCWASLWSTRALIYRARHHIPHQTVQMAVIVQHMVEARASGVLFTCNPITNAQDELIINAAFGLGEAVVSGQVTPDTITLDKHTGQVKRLDVAEKVLMTAPASTTNGVETQVIPAEVRTLPVLSASQLTRLFELGTTVEQLFSTPQDIEWAMADDQVFLLQARPVTTLVRKQTVTVCQEDLPVPGDDHWDRREKPEAHTSDLWTRVNIGENFLDPITPLSATLWPTFFLLGHFPSPEERAPEAPPLPLLGERFYGRLYVNEGALIRGAIEMGMPTGLLDSTWGTSGRGRRSSDDTIHIWRLLSRIPRVVGDARKAAKEQVKKQPAIPKQKQPRRSPEQLFAQIDAWVDEFQRTDLSQLDDRALWDVVPLWIERGKELRRIVFGAGLAGIAFYFLERKVSKWTGKPGQATVLVQALSGVYTAEVGSLLWQMAQMLNGAGLAEVVQKYPSEKALELLRKLPEAQPFRIQFEAFIQRHGYRCPNDAELHNPRWAEQPAQVIEMVKSYLRLGEQANPLTIEQRRMQEREETVKHLTTQIHPFRRPLFRWLLKQAQNKTRQRDNIRSYVAKFLLPMRLILVEFGRRWAERRWLADPDDLFFLTLYEVGDIVRTGQPNVLGSDLITITAARRTAFDYWHTIEAPAALGPGGAPLPDPQPTGVFLQGLPASAGRARGMARLVESMNEAVRLSPGEILVTRGTDPGWTPVFPLVSGLVLETGGLLSHGAIIAREYGVPAVINVPGALSTIKDGQIIEVDRTNGRVYLDPSGADGMPSSASLQTRTQAPELK
ncbi:PEP/pyruvate-binding domain-containing protein [Ktedonobacter racemifer]|uniref:Pyruvate phosphate dikinase PEP/pyruvate-binding n=1 Tax=Ktedonobacter racemifer DSM 44963 TaxID=485913 RepID=D6TWJ2_KTERA|nr:PEP/pyruvate-binding domain-containing protein [Ktedonobacter racemifer]EFH84575.1 pyruvate phosphate dikinase PEP/pyruvate-binding [Ktedonobacter racemifer DSM 44963]